MCHRRARLLFVALLFQSVAPAIGQPITAAQPPVEAPQTQPAPRPVPGVPAGVKAIRNVEYAQVDGRALKLDIYLPQTLRPAPPNTPDAEKPVDAPAAKPTHDKLPVIIWVHGGGWSAGNKNSCPAALFVPSGFAAVSISYRFTQVAPFPAQIHDCKGAVRWVRAHAAEYGFDPDRIGVWGASAGGHLVALLGTTAGNKELEGTTGGNLGQSSSVQAVCDWFGPADILKLASVDEEHPTDHAAVIPAVGLLDKLMGGPVREHVELAKLASPTRHISRGDPPFLVMHGDNDDLVPISQSELLVKALEAAGVEVSMHVVKGAGHGFGGVEEINMVAEFFKDKLSSMPKP